MSPSREPARYLLPAAAYTSPEWFEREQRELFARAWLLAGLERDLAKPGDFLTVQAGKEPLAIVRQRSGELRAFYNFCRHRGAMLLHGTGNVSAGISCFYHHWHYNLDGTLRALPQADKFPSVTADKSKFGLKPASVATWNGLVFVNAEHAPEHSLAIWLGDLPSRWGPWKPNELRELPGSSIEVACNWKLFIENHIDGYHLWHLHGESVRNLAHEKQSWRWCGRHWVFYEPEEVAGTASDHDWFNLPLIPGVDPSRYGSSVFMLFPNVGAAGFPTFFAMFVVEPLAADRTRIRFRTFIKAVSEQDYIANPELRTQVESAMSTPILGYDDPASVPFTHRLAAAAERKDFVTEDKLAVEAVQRALKSQRFEVGPLALDYEEAIPFFHECVVQFVPQNERAGGSTRDP